MDGLDAGADDYLTKPFTARELLARVSAHLAMRRRRMEAEEALKESQATLQSFYDSSPFFMGVIELHGDAVVPLYWNAAAAASSAGRAKAPAGFGIPPAIETALGHPLPAKQKGEPFGSLRI